MELTFRRSAASEFVSRLVAHLLPVTYFLVTVSFFLKTYDSAQVKITIAQIGCSLTAVLWLAQLALERRMPFRRGDLPLAAPFIAVLASGVLSWAQSSFPAGSFEEGVRRILYAFMGFIVIAEFRGLDRQRRLLRWLIAGFALVVFYGFVQYLDTRLFPPGLGEGLDPFVWRQAFGPRVFSSFGNPNFYGNFLVIITPILLVTFLKEGGQVFRPYVLLPVLAAIVVLADKLCLGGFGGVAGNDRLFLQLLLIGLVLSAAVLVFWRSPTGAASAMLLFFGVMFITLYATETKGSWVGFVGALVATLVLAGLFLTGGLGRALTRRLLMVALATAILGGAVVGYYARQRIQSVSFRVFTWISTWEMIREQPWLGAGIGTFKWTYPAYRRPEIILLEAKSNTETDHAEEEYLEIWSDEGLLGLGLFLWLILTVSVAGLSALKRLTAGRGPPAGPDGERVYSLVAFLGAWWAALLHWAMDVSVRFVSSGIYSLLLPAVVANLSRAEAPPHVQDAPAPMDRWVRAATALFWTGVFLSLPRFYDSLPAVQQILPALGLGLALWALGEILEWKSTPPPSVAPAFNERRPSLVRGAVAAALLGGWSLILFPLFRGFFLADLHHNIAIFFSKNRIWQKSAEFDPTAAELPPQMKEEYSETGGALENYHRVTELNPYFPMARYFIGNVYNDWGTIHFDRWRQASSAGRSAEAAEALATAKATWDEAEREYERLKAFAPNYVQTHHQMGTLYLKRMQMASQTGATEDVRRFGDIAMKNFELYRLLDPVFPPNHYRMAQIDLFNGDWDKTEKDYRGALVYNVSNVIGRPYPERNIETYVLLGRLMVTRLEQAMAGKSAPADIKSPAFAAAEEYFNAALACYGALGESPEYRAFAMDAHKGLGLLYLRAHDRARASRHWGWVQGMDPHDADLRAVTGQK